MKFHLVDYNVLYLSILFTRPQITFFHTKLDIFKSKIFIIYDGHCRAKYLEMRKVPTNVF